MTAVDVSTIRQKLGMTQQELADELGVAQATVSQWEAGLRNPRPMVAKLLRRVESDRARKNFSKSS